MNTIRDFLAFRNKTHVPTVGPYDTVATAIQKMADANLGALLVQDEGEVVGLFSERDYARKLLLHGKSSLVTPVHEVMVTKVIYVTPDYLLEECLALMTSKHIRHLPVMEKGRPVALVSIDEIVEATLEGKEFVIAELTKYITGSPTYMGASRFDKRAVRELVWMKPGRFGPSSATA